MQFPFIFICEINILFWSLTLSPQILDFFLLCGVWCHSFTLLVFLPMSDFWLCGRFHIACVWMLFLSVTASSECGVGAECAPGWDVLLVCLLNGFSSLRTRAHCLSCCLPLLSTGRNGDSSLEPPSFSYLLTLGLEPIFLLFSPFQCLLSPIPTKLLLLRAVSTSLLPNLKVSNWLPFCETLHALWDPILPWGHSFLASLPEQPVLFNLSLLIFFLFYAALCVPTTLSPSISSKAPGSFLPPSIWKCYSFFLEHTLPTLHLYTFIHCLVFPNNNQLSDTN